MNFVLINVKVVSSSLTECILVLVEIFLAKKITRGKRQRVVSQQNSLKIDKHKK